MKKHFLYFSHIFLLTSLFVALVTRTSAQQQADSASIKKLLDKAGVRQKALPTEKLYINFDKPYYAVGDTAWLKAYVFMDNKASAYSGKLYVELLNANNQLVQRLVLPVATGLATGYFALDAKKITEGSYTIRAYTNWMQNFGADMFFYKQFYIGKLGGKTWLVTEQHRRDNPADTNHVQLAMRFTDAKGLPLVTRKVTVRLLDGAKTLLKSEMTTGVDGALTGAFTLPAKINRQTLSIAVEDAGDKDQHITFPFYPSGAGGGIDLQFMPEGGSMVTGLLNRIGFKAIGDNGISRDVKGVIVDSKNEEAATLQSVHNGMGSFVLVPQAGENYTAKVIVNGIEKRYPLPKAKDFGIAFRVDAINHADELYIYISTNAADTKSYTLIAQSDNTVYFGLAFKFNADNYFNTRINKSKLPTGVITLTILGLDNKPLNQRNVFVNHSDGLKLSTLTGQSVYKPKDSIALNVHVVDVNGSPVQANFSVAVTDDAQIKDPVATDNIVSHILLTSELAGHIESPAWYFSQDETDVKLKDRALDNLLLTQGWHGFDWANIDTPLPAPAYLPETDINITGRLKGFFGGPASKLKVSLFANGKQPFLQDTISDKDGRFAFRNLPVSDTVAYLVKLHNKRDKTAAAEISVDEFKPTQAKVTGLLRAVPWNMNADTALINYINQANQRRQIADAFVPPDGGKVLKQVDIIAQRKTKVIGGEFATEINSISEEELIAAKKMSLMDIIYKKFPGFMETRLYAENISARTQMHADVQFTNGSALIWAIIADGQNVGDPTSLVDNLGNSGEAAASPVPANGGSILSPSANNSDPNAGAIQREATRNTYSDMKDFLNSVGADDVKSISLLRGYHTYLSITTRSGKGANTRTSLGTYAYRPPFMQMPKLFYTPKYSINNKTTLPDLRSTIHWEPNLVTDASGNAKLSFYAADKPSTYTVVIEGTDMQGHFGVSNRKIIISQNTADAKQ